MKVTWINDNCMLFFRYSTDDYATTYMKEQTIREKVLLGTVKV